MIILFDRRLLPEVATGALRSSSQATLLISPIARAVEPRWKLQATSEFESLGSWLLRLLSPPPEQNKFVIVWKEPDTSLKEVVKLLTKQQAEFLLKASVLLVGPLPPGYALERLDEQTSKTQSVVSSVLYIGNEDTKRNEIDEKRRLGVLTALLEGLAELGDKALESFGLASAPGDERVYCAFGFRRWGPGWADYRSCVRGLALRVLREQLVARGEYADEYEHLLALGPESLLNKVRSLDTPMSVSPKAGSSQRFSEQLPAIPDNPFAGWPCPHSREAALEDGRRHSAAFKPRIFEYYFQLQEELWVLATRIRVHGRTVSLNTCEEIRGKIAAENSLGGLAVLLKTYFPAFESLKNRHRESANSPCEPASFPSPSDCHLHFIDNANSFLLQQADILLKASVLVWIWVGIIMLFFASLPALYFGIPFRLAVLPGLVGVACGVGFYMWVRARARRVSSAMEQYFDRELRWLRTRFVDKLEWVNKKTQLTVEHEVIAEAQVLCRRLRENFEELFHQWQDIWRDVSIRPPGDGVETQGTQFGIRDQDLEHLKEQIARMAPEIVAVVLSAEVGDRRDRNLSSRVDALILELQKLVVRGVVPITEIQEELHQCAKERISLPLLARLDPNTLETNIRKSFVLPARYPDIDDLVQHPIGATVEIIRGDVSGPMLWVARTELDRETAKDSLTRRTVTS